MPAQLDDVLLSVSVFRAARILVSSSCLHDCRISPTEANMLQLHSSLRNALSTFGPNSVQYLNIKFMIDEYAAKLALENLSLSFSNSER